MHVKEVEKSGTRIKTGENGFRNLSDLDTHRDSISEELKSVKWKDLNDMVYRLELSYHENIDVLDVKCIAGSTKGYTLAPGVYRITDISLFLKTLLPKEVKVSVTIDDIRLNSNITNNKTIRFTKRFFLYIFRIHSIASRTPM